MTLKPTREAWLGPCKLCGDPREPGEVLCATCLDEARRDAKLAASHQERGAKS